MTTHSFSASGKTDESIDIEQVIVGGSDVITRPETFKSGANVAALTVCGRITASGKLIKSVATAADGSQVPRAICIGDVASVTADKVGPAYIAGEFNADALAWDASWTSDAQKMSAFGNGPIVLRLLRSSVAAVTVAEDTTLNATHQKVLVDATEDDVVIALPTAASAFDGDVGRIYTVEKVDDSANTVTVDGNAAETIGGAATQVLTAQYQSIRIQSDGTAWSVLAP